LTRRNICVSARASSFWQAAPLQSRAAVTDPTATATSSALDTWLDERLQRMLEEVPLGVVHLDEEGRVQHHNASATMLFDGPNGLELERILRDMCARADDSPEPIETALSFGHHGEVRVLVSRAACLGGHLAILERNTVARARAESRVMRSLLTAATEAVTPQQAAHRALSTMALSLAGSSLVLYELNAPRRELECLAHVNVSHDHAALLGARPLDGQSLVSRVVLLGQPLHVANLSRSFFSVERSLAGGDRLAALALPVKANAELVGALYVVGPRGMLTDGEVKLVQGLADAVGALISHSRRDSALRAHQRSLQSLLDNLPDAIFERNDEGLITVAAGQVLALTGRPPAALVGTRLSSIVADEDRERFDEMLRAISDTAAELGEFSVLRGEARVSCEVSAWVTMSEQGHRLVRAIFRDVSSRKQLEADVQRARETAIKRDRLALIGQLAAGVAHEINNPLSFVKSNLSLVPDVLSDLNQSLEKIVRSTDEKSRDRALDGLKVLATDLVDMATETMEGVERIAVIVASLKGTARTRPDERQTFDPVPSVTQATQFFTGGRHCRDLVSLSLPTLPPVIGEPGGLSQIILNLLDNAYDATQGATNKAARIVVSGEAKDDRVLLKVSDNGSGIPPHVQAHLFEPFFTTKGVGKGTGLGLHISHELAARFGGRLRFETSPTGTTFIVELVRAPPEEDEAPHG
jgi:two-component system sensor histidine kinase HupT/HoxJ